MATMMFSGWGFDVPLHPRGGCCYWPQERLSIWDYWSVRKEKWQQPCSGGTGQKSHAGNVCIWHARTDGVLEYRLPKVQGEMASRADLVLEDGERGVGFQTERFHAVFLLNEGWRKKIWVRVTVEERENGHYSPDKFIVLQCDSCRFAISLSVWV